MQATLSTSAPGMCTARVGSEPRAAMRCTCARTHATAQSGARESSGSARKSSTRGTQAVPESCGHIWRRCHGAAHDVHWCEQVAAFGLTWTITMPPELCAAMACTARRCQCGGLRVPNYAHLQRTADSHTCVSEQSGQRMTQGLSTPASSSSVEQAVSRQTDGLPLERGGRPTWLRESA